ncbi:hypothetical protein ACFX13_035792 [Malus domestica]
MRRLQLGPNYGLGGGGQMLSKSKQRETQNVQIISSRRPWVVSMSMMMGPFGPGAMTARVQPPSENVPSMLLFTTTLSARTPSTAPAHWLKM